MDTINKELIERYPYLMPKNLWDGSIPEDYDYSYTRADEVGQGWRKLFLMMCEDIRQPLIDAGYLDQFQFSQIKEKYGKLCAYNFGAPKEVQDIIYNYEIMSKFVCNRCGKPTSWETLGWIEYICDDCYKKHIDNVRAHVAPIGFTGRTVAQIPDPPCEEDYHDGYHQKLSDEQLEAIKEADWRAYEDDVRIRPELIDIWERLFK